VSLQENEKPSAYYRDVIGSMLEEVDRLSYLVQNLLTLARADAGRIPVNRSDTDVSELVRNAIDHIRILAEEKKQNIRFKDEADDVTVNVDVDKLRQAVVNVLDNAIKYSPETGQIFVRVSDSKSEFFIEIRDDGPGMPAEELERIFDRFYRISKDRSSSEGGTGLGLSITRWAVELHDGRIDIESQPGEGTMVRIIIPKKDLLSK